MRNYLTQVLYESQQRSNNISIYLLLILITINTIIQSITQYKINTISKQINPVLLFDIYLKFINLEIISQQNNNHQHFYQASGENKQSNTNKESNINRSMSQQYQRFKQTFFSQHPQYTNSNNTRTNIYGISESINRNNINNDDNNLHIQQQSHYPFEQMQQSTYGENNNQLYGYGNNNSNMNYNINNINNNSNVKNNMNNMNSNNINNNMNRQSPPSTYLGLNEQNYQQQDQQNGWQDRQYRQEISKYKVNNQYAQDRGYTNDINDKIQKQQQQKQLQRINSQLTNLRMSSNNNKNIISNDSNDNNVNSKYLHPSYFANSNSVSNNSNSISNNNNMNSNNTMNGTPLPTTSNTLRPQLLPQSPKQLPIIYNTTATTIGVNNNSSTKSINNPSNSRVIIQSMPREQQQLQPHFINSNINNISNISNSNSKQHSRIIIPQQQQQQYIAQQQQYLVQQQQQNQLPINNNPNTNSKISLTSYNNLRQIPQLLSPSHTLPQQHLPIIIPTTSANITTQHHQYLSQQQHQRLHQQLQSQQNQLITQSQQITKLKQQNLILVQRIKSFQQAEKQSYQKFKNVYQILLKKYQQSLSKQCGLLVDRCRLEMRHNRERY